MPRGRSSRRKRLHGAPLGLKDLIDTGDMPTEYASPIYKGRRPTRRAGQGVDG